MILNFSKEEKLKILKLCETKQININIADIFLSLFDDKNIINPDKLNIEMLENNIDRNEAVTNLILDYLQIDLDNEENIDIINRFIKPAIKEVDIKKYLDNPYYKLVKPFKINNKNISLEYESYDPYELFPLNEIKINENYEELSSIGYAKEKLTYLTLKENKTTWMSIIPNEINTMEKSIEEAEGNVITFGLGLGYFAFMASNKKEVNSVTIVEKNQTIIDIFNNYILPKFPNKNKIKVIKSDAILFLKNNKEKYDFAFVDLWHDANDGLPIYLKFKALENNSIINKFSYWLEESIKVNYCRAFLVVLEEQLNGSNEKNYQHANNELDVIINNIYYLTKNLVFNNYKDVINYLDKIVK